MRGTVDKLLAGFGANIRKRHKFFLDRTYGRLASSSSLLRSLASPRSRSMGQPAVFDCGGARRGSPIPHALRKAVEYIRRDVSRRMSVADLAAHCGLPERTLRKQLQDFMGASPLEFWRHARLAAVHDHLLKGANDISVMDTAARFGFSHFGRFSQQYRR